MTIITLVLVIIAFIFGSILTFFIQRANSVSRKKLETVKTEMTSISNQLSSREALINEKSERINILTAENKMLTEENKAKDVNLARLDNKLDNLDNLKLKIDNYETIIEVFKDDINKLREENLRYEAQNNSMKEKLELQKKEIEKMSEKTLLEFESIANKIFEEKTKNFSKVTKDNIDQVLAPLKENLKDFKKKVEETYDKESKERFSLESKIKELVQLNQQISKEANNLTKALKGEAKTQGNWGEMILESILEHSGLVKDREYFIQELYKETHNKRKQPDVIIKYPNDRHIVVDSKVSLTAYERFSNCDDSDKQKIHLKDHMKSIRKHIDDLSSKDYDKIEKSLDFVMLFIPIEPAYMTAIHYDKDLWSYAYKKRILLISPTNLIAALKMVADIWKREYQNENAVAIARRGELLYEKFAGFVSDMEDIGKFMNKASDKYSDAIDKLSKGQGNLIWQAEKLKSMGLNPKANKSIPEKYLDKNIGTE